MVFFKRIAVILPQKLDFLIFLWYDLSSKQKYKEGKMKKGDLPLPAIRALEVLFTNKEFDFPTGIKLISWSVREKREWKPRIPEIGKFLEEFNALDSVLIVTEAFVYYFLYFWDQRRYEDFEFVGAVIDYGDKHKFLVKSGAKWTEHP